MSTDPSQNFMASYPPALDLIFLPKNIAVIGAKDNVGSVGRTLLLNLISGKFQGKIYPINPKRSHVLDLPAYPRVQDVPEPIDLAVIVTPAKTVPGIVRDCVEANVKGIIIISAGFKELGPEGVLLEQEVLDAVRGKNIPIIGPNCLGVMHPATGLNASFARGIALPGNIAFISQSGAMCTAVLDWSFTERIGFSAFGSIGSMIDVGWGDLIRYFGNDPLTDSILIYMETIGDPRAFLSAARAIALEKPIIVIKPGRSQEAARAAASHTGSLTGSDEVFDAALERVGVLRVNSIAELFHMAKVLGKQPRPKGPNLHIITNAGGPAVLATDAAVMAGAKIPPLSLETEKKLNEFLPAPWSHANPIDVLGDADAACYAKTMDVLAKDPESDGLLVVLSPQDMTDPIGTAEVLRAYSKTHGKSVLASWMGGGFVKPGIEILNNAGIPTFEYPDAAAWSFASMWAYNENLISLYETPMTLLSKNGELPRIEEARVLINKVLKEGRTLLSEVESKQLLLAYGIPAVQTVIAINEQEAVEIAKKIGFPVVLKLFSHTITHKSDFGGVKLNITTEAEVKKAFEDIYNTTVKAAGIECFQGVTVQPMIKTKGIELIFGSSCDPQFGPVLLFGSGGVMVEIFKDHALGFPPLNSTLAKRMMRKTKIYEALKGFRGQKQVSIRSLEDILVSFSLMIANEPWIKECDINPLLASGDTFIALDARIVLHSPDLTEDQLPRLSIRPYPMQYITEKELKSGERICLRPVRLEDEPALGAFHKDLSENSVRQRYFEFKTLSERVAHDRLVQICTNDFDHQIALVAEIKSSIMGVARLARIGNGTVADLKILIGDAFQRKGLGTLFVTELLRIAKIEGIEEVIATVLSENSGMIHILKRAGFELREEAMFVFAKKRLGN